MSWSRALANLRKTFRVCSHSVAVHTISAMRVSRSRLFRLTVLAARSPSDRAKENTASIHNFNLSPIVSSPT